MYLLRALAYLAAAVVVHAVAVRSPWAADRVRKFLWVGVAFGVALGVRVTSAEDFGTEAAAALVAYALGCELYLFLFTLAGTSVSVRVLLSLRQGERTEAELTAEHDAAGMVGRRLQRLRDVGLLEGAGDDLRVTPAGRRLVVGYRLLRRLFGLVRERSREVRDMNEPFARGRAA